MAETEAQIGSLSHGLAACEAHVSEIHGELVAKEATIQGIYQSLSWRATKPLRALGQLFAAKPSVPPNEGVSATSAQLHEALNLPQQSVEPSATVIDQTVVDISSPIDSLPDGFNEALYLQIYPDVASAGIDPKRHYMDHGRFEGRVFSAPTLIELASANFKGDRKTVLLVSHEASRTGAPILSWNLAQVLFERYNVVTLLLGDGPLVDSFRSCSSTVLLRPSLRHNPVLTRLTVAQLCLELEFEFAIINSIESRIVLHSLADFFVPAINLVHEFATYTRPKSAFRDSLFWSAEVVFSADITMQNAFAEFPDVAGRAVHTLHQGKCLLPANAISNEQIHLESAQLVKSMRPAKLAEDTLLVLGAGFVQIRKGVDLFIECATRVLRAPGGSKCRFVWIGKGFDPENDLTYSVYLADQIRRAGMQEHIVFIDETSSIETAYAEADIFLLSSRLDPLPNVAIDAMVHGVPVVCFDKTTGIADFLINSGLQSNCVASYLDSGDMARKILDLARSSELREKIGILCQKAAIAHFDMHKYVNQLELLALSAGERQRQEQADVKIIIESGLFRQDFVRLPSAAAQSMESDVRQYVRGWASGLCRRKPFPGFHPGIYLEMHGLKTEGSDPLADYLREGRPAGLWSYPVMTPDETGAASQLTYSPVALHLHVYYPDLLPEILMRLQVNTARPDLFISINGEEARELVTSALQSYEGEVIEIKVVPNQGRDIGPLITEFGSRIVNNYEFFGHIHTKKSADVKDVLMGKIWYNFLLNNLLGDESTSMADRILSRLSHDLSIGLIFPDDPYIVGMGDNLGFAEVLAARLGLDDIPVHFIFPVGTMFWGRTEVLQPFVHLNLDWSHYPEEPLPYDGSMLHALERLFALSTLHNGLRIATTNIPGLTR